MAAVLWTDHSNNIAHNSSMVHNSSSMAHRSSRRSLSSNMAHHRLHSSNTTHRSSRRSLSINTRLKTRGCMNKYLITKWVATTGQAIRVCHNRKQQPRSRQPTKGKRPRTA